MRESMGATFLLKIMIVFIFFFSAFLAIAINYSQAFRIKNQIINAIENYEGYNKDSRKIIASVVNNSGYYRNVNCSGNKGISATDGSSLEKEINGVCISGKKHTDNGVNKAYYKVTTYVSFNFPIIGNVITVPVVGETTALKCGEDLNRCELNGIDYSNSGVNEHDNGFWRK